MFRSMFTSNGFLAGLASVMGMGRLIDLIGPPLPSGPATRFRKRGRNHKKMMKNPPNRTGWFQRHADIAPMLVTERMLMRHGWYRRKLRKEGIWMRAVGPNSVMLTADGISPEKMGVRL